MKQRSRLGKTVGEVMYCVGYDVFRVFGWGCVLEQPIFRASCFASAQAPRVAI
jgi:hypothetical protein